MRDFKEYGRENRARQARRASSGKGNQEVHIRNLTPHDLHIESWRGNIITIPAEDAPAPRVGVVRSRWRNIDFGGEPIRVNTSSSDDVENLPERAPGTVLVVSRLVAEAAKVGRSDLMFPGELIRDDSGRVVGCRGLDRLY